MSAKEVVSETHEVSETSWSWLRCMSRELYKLDQTPLLGYTPEFPWETFAKSLATTLGIQECSVQPGDLIWREKAELTKEISEPLYWTEIVASGIDGSCFFVMSKHDTVTLMEKVLGISCEAVDCQLDELKDNFQRFICVQSVHLINSLDFDKRISFRIASFAKELQESALCQDIYVSIGKEKMLFRLCLKVDFQQACRAFYQKGQKTPTPTKYRLEQTLVPLHIEVGKTAISLNELLAVKPGDFLFIDRPIFIPDSEENHVIVSLQDKPLFLAELKDGDLKILEIPLQHEVYDSMVDKVNPPFAPSGIPNQKPPKMPEIDDEENPFEDEEEEEEEENVGMEDLEQAQKIKEAATAATKEKPKSAAKPVSQGPLKELTANDIPLTLTVEVGQINLTAQKLLELQAGNVIDLDLSVEHGVDLVVNGRIIGKGELLKIGDSIGVRILQIGT